MFDHTKILPFRRIGAQSHDGSYDTAAFPRFAKEFANPGLKLRLLKTSKVAQIRRNDPHQLQ